MKEIRLIIAGCRNFYDKEIAYKYIKDTIDKLTSMYPEYTVHIISGGARGADSLGESYAKDHNIKLSVYPADWEKYGKSAGYIRNHQMVDAATEDKNDIPHLLAFWDMKSPGTNHTIIVAKGKHIPTTICDIKNKISHT